MPKVLYKGFSTANWLKDKTFSLNDIDLVKRDLLNHIYTIKGERVMMANFGTHIPVMAFEPNDERTRVQIEQELREVIEYDPRVKLISVNVLSLPDNNAIIALADVLYVEFNVTETLHIEVASQ